MSTKFFLISTYENYRLQALKSYGIDGSVLDQMVASERSQAWREPGSFSDVAGTMDLQMVLVDYALVYEAGKKNMRLLADSLARIILEYVFGADVLIPVLTESNTVVVELWVAIRFSPKKKFRYSILHKGKPVVFIPLGIVAE